MPAYLLAFLCTVILSPLQMNRTMQPLAIDTSQLVALLSDGLRSVNISQDNTLIQYKNAC